MNQLLILLLVLGIIISANIPKINAQCIDKFTGEDQNRGYKFETKKQPGEPDKIYTYIFVTFDSSQRFKIALDADVSSAFAKANDYITFSVLENVYGTGKMPGETIKGEKLEKGIVEKRCVIIPKNTKIYGNVDFANSRYPLNIGGRAKLFITVKSIKLEDGTEIPIAFAEPLDQVINQGPFKNVIQNCKHYESRKCVAGRRAKYSLPPNAIGAGASTGLLLVKDEDDKVTNVIAGLTFLDSLSKVSGIDGIINPPNAELKGKMVFDVITEGIDATHTLGVWVALSQPTSSEKGNKKQDTKQ